MNSCNNKNMTSENNCCLMAALNGRSIPKEDTIFGINRRAGAAKDKFGADNVINGTIGALLDDAGDLIVLSSVAEAFSRLKPVEYAKYAPIGGIPEFRQAAIKAALKNYKPNGFVRAVATPGGTGALHLAAANYSSPGDAILTADWFWSPYKTIAAELGMSIATFTLLGDDGGFNAGGFISKVGEILKTQDRLVIFLNTPAQNPTGYSLSDQDWLKIRDGLASIHTKKRIALVADTAYIDFAGDEDECRSFLPIIEDMPENVLPIIAFSMSKTFTIYGLRCGAAICMAKNEEVADEFVRVCEFSARGAWSNSPRTGQSVIANIFDDPGMLAAVTKERAEIRQLLLDRGRAFTEAAESTNLPMMPYCGGFFVSIPCDDPVATSRMLENEGIFLVPLSKGLRASVASISKAKCEIMPEKVLKTLKRK